LSVSFGHNRQMASRNSPTIMNTAAYTHLFWDGRASSLEDQALSPIVNDKEMNAAFDIVEKRLNDDETYRKQFKDVFGVDHISSKEISHAIACFERTVVSGRSKFDSFIKGKTHVLSDEAVRGLHVYRTVGSCMNCHSGPNFSDDKFHNLGISNYGRKFQDLGRYEVTKDPKDVGAFRTPTLRNVERTSPYMHSGLFEFDEVLTLYNIGMFEIKRKPSQQDDPLFPTKSPLLKPLGMNDKDVADLKAFLFSLTEPKERVRRE